MATPNSNFDSFQVTLASAGTAQRIFATTFKSEINAGTVKAMAGNSGKIYVGGSDTSATVGFELSAGDGLSLDAINGANLWFDGSSTSDKIAVFWAGP